MTDHKSRTKIFTVALALTTSVFVGASSVGAQTLTLTSVTPPIAPTGQDGELDHTFGANDVDGVDGFIQLNQETFWGFTFLGKDAVQQSDGKILTVALNTDLTIGSLNNREIIQDDNLITIAQPALWNSTIQRRNYDGSIDSTFGQDGSITFNDLVGISTLVLKITLQPDGKILLAGLAETDNQVLTTLENDPIQTTVSISQSYPFVARLLIDGTLDTSFGTNGFIEIDNAGFDFGYASEVFVQSDGKIVVAGNLDDRIEPTSDVSARTTTPSSFFIYRMFADGSLDTTFADAGAYIANNNLDNPFISSVFQQSDGKLVAVGTGNEIDTSNQRMFAMRLTSVGTLDETYGVGGVTSLFTENSVQDLVRAVMQPDNQLIVVNNFPINDNEYYSAVIERITADGDIDQGFGTNGDLVVSDGASNTSLFGLAIQPDGKIITTGITAINDFNLVNTVVKQVTYRFRKNGTLDETFGESGKVTFDLIPNLVGTAVIVQPNGQLLILGTELNNNLNATHDFILRLNSAKPVSVNGVTPSRLLDTRAGSPQGTIVVEKTKFGESKELRFKIAGVSGLPEFGIAAATINLTATEPEATGYITVYPCGMRPLASNLNFVKDQTASTSVTTAVSPSGEICLYSSAQTNLIVDVNGWSAPNAGYTSINPQRLLDTRALSPQGEISIAKKKYGPDSELRVKVAGAAGLPGARIGSVSLNVTVTEPENEGFITVYPCGTRPLASSLNFVTNQTISASVTSPVSADGEICIYSSVPTNLIADAFGWFVQGSGITPVGPTRLVDTRTASPQGSIAVTQKKYGAADELRLPLNGVADLPDDGIGSVQLTVTVTNPNASGFITVYPCGTLPLASHLNYTTGQTIAASVTALVSADGEVCIYSNQSTNIIVDVNGWGNQPQYRCGGILEIPDDKNINVAAC